MADEKRGGAAVPLKKTPYSHLLRIVHWILSITVLVSLYSGVAVHCLARPEWSLIGKFPAFMLGGRVVLWHLIAGALFAPAVVIATFSFFKKRQNVNLIQARWIANLFLIIGGVGCCLSMLGLIYTGVPPWFYHVCRGMHFVCGLIVIPLALLTHLWLAATKHSALLIPVYAPLRQRNLVRLLFIPAALVIAYLLIFQTPSRGTTARTLTAAKTDRKIATIADAKSLPWDSARPLDVTLVNGNGFYKGVTRLTLKAMHDGERLFVAAKWEDPSQSRQYWPWLKTEEGWKHLVSEEKDEKIYYEDKFSLIFPVEKSANFVRFGCAIHCHTKGGSYGYKAADEIIDVWHWKSSRTDPMNYCDDKHWLGHDRSLKDVGRIADPRTGGGDAKNDSADGTTPAFLPAKGYTVVGGALPMDKAVPYSAATAAEIPVGVTVPGTMVSRADGDRGDVQCLSRHDDGHWTLYLMRKLDTGSKFDVKFVPGGEVDFAAAAFDHSAKRHAYNQQVYRLVLQ